MICYGVETFADDKLIMICYSVETFAVGRIDSALPPPSRRGTFSLGLRISLRIPLRIPLRLKRLSLLRRRILCSTILPTLTNAMTTLTMLATLFRRQLLISIQSSRIIDFVSQYTSYLLHTGVFLPPSQHSLDTLSTHTMRVLPEAGDSEQGTALVRVYLFI